MYDFYASLKLCYKCRIWVILEYVTERLLQVVIILSNVKALWHHCLLCACSPSISLTMAEGVVTPFFVLKAFLCVVAVLILGSSENPLCLEARVDGGYLLSCASLKVSEKSVRKEGMMPSLPRENGALHI